MRGEQIAGAGFRARRGAQPLAALAPPPERVALLLGAEDRGLSSAAAAEAGVPATVNRVGSMLTAFFCEGPVVDYTSAKRADTNRYGRFHAALMDKGVYLALESGIHQGEQFLTWCDEALALLATVEKTAS